MHALFLNPLALTFQRNLILLFQPFYIPDILMADQVANLNPSSLRLHF